MKPTNPRHSLLKTAYRPLVIIVIAGCSWADVTLAQEGALAAAAAPAGAAADTGGGTTSAFRGGTSTSGSGASKKSPFAYNTGETSSRRSQPLRKYNEPDPEPLSASSKNVDEPASRFVAPNFYGRGPQVVTPGQGQYARPKFRGGVSVGIGYDDNPDQISSVNLTTVARPRKGSGFNWVNGHWDAQWLKPRTVFTVNLEAGANFYWDRPGNSSDFNGRLGMLYINKIDPLTQVSATASFAYLSQPDYSNIFASTNQAGGDYFTGSTKFDLSHRWTPVFSTTTSASVNLLKYTQENAAQNSNSYWNFTFGNEFRFQSSTRYTWVAEGRFGLDEYISNRNLNSQTAYVLGGLDWIASRHMTATVRAGASFRNFDAGGNASAPYAEMSLSYLTGRHSSLTLNARYGFEQSSTVGDENLSYRLGLIYQHAFTSRFSGNAGFNFVHSDNSPRTGAGATSDVYDLSLGAQYRIDRHFSFGARYNYTLQETSTGGSEFDRNRVLVYFQYEY